MCDTDLDNSVYSGGEWGLQFCDSCFYKFDLLKVDKDQAEKTLMEIKDEGRRAKTSK